MKHTKHMKFGAENAREGEGAMARITALINQKGGVAKTTTAHALAVGLARQGSACWRSTATRRAICPFDAGGRYAGRAVRGAAGDAAAADVIQATRQGVDLVASSLDLSAADMEFTRVGREYLLRGLCDAVAASYDHIIVDCPPALGVLTLNALTAADDMVIPVGLEVFSLQGLKQLFNTVENVRRYCNPRLTVAGILITRRGNRASLTRELIDVIGQTAKDLNVYLYPTVIREAVAVREAQVMQESLFDSHPKAAVTADYAAFVADYLRQEDEKHGD
ncbi:MAG: ParA family protein [Christensenellales bacterium]